MLTQRWLSLLHPLANVVIFNFLLHISHILLYCHIPRISCNGSILNWLLILFRVKFPLLTQLQIIIHYFPLPSFHYALFLGCILCVGGPSIAWHKRIMSAVLRRGRHWWKPALWMVWLHFYYTTHTEWFDSIFILHTQWMVWLNFLFYHTQWLVWLHFYSTIHKQTNKLISLSLTLVTY